MEKLLDELKDTLKQDDRLFADDKLLKNKAIERALDNDEKLLELLAANERLKEHFFTEAGEHLVFDEEKFAQFVSNKQFLPDSYTAFKNKVGLKQGNEHLQEKEEIELAWPYKDCVLEGGQTKEDEGREEKFWNKTLAPDQVDTLLNPKALKGFKRVTEDGEKDVEGISEDDNLFIRGNNLLALSSLDNRYTGEIDFIYIDPPYNTGNDSFKYNDRFNHSTWLTFMKNRLESAKNLLTEEGSIVVQCDDNEQAYLKVLMDEVFGKKNFVNTVSVKMSNLSGPKMAHVDQKLPKLNEYLLIYSKTDKFAYNVVTTDIKQWNPEYSRLLVNFNREDYEFIKKLQNKDSVSKDDVQSLNEALSDVQLKNVSEAIQQNDIEKPEEWKRENSYRIIRKHSGTSVKELAEKKKIYGLEQEIAAMKSENELYLTITDYNREATEPRMQIVFAKDNLEKPVGNLWTDINTSGFQNQGGVKLKNGKKPEELLKRIIQLTTDKGDLVLDFFLGSGTTAAVAHKMDRQYIGIEQLDYGDSDPTVRLKNVIKGDDTGISDVVGWDSGGDFVYAEIMQWNAEFIERIEDAESSEELKEVWSDMEEQAFLSYRIDVEEFEENAEKFEDLELEKQKEFLNEILDNNQLYVNYSEIEDSDYDLDEETIELNKQFYEGE